MRKIILSLSVLFLLGSSAVQGADLYVDLNCVTPVSPYTNWATAATDIQSAVDAAVDGDTVWVTNGVYNTGGAVTPGTANTNRVCITNALALRSVNGSDVTVIEGGGSFEDETGIRCVYLGENSTLALTPDFRATV